MKIAKLPTSMIGMTIWNASCEKALKIGSSVQNLQMYGNLGHRENGKKCQSLSNCSVPESLTSTQKLSTLVIGNFICCSSALFYNPSTYFKPCVKHNFTVSDILIYSPLNKSTLVEKYWNVFFHTRQVEDKWPAKIKRISFMSFAWLQVNLQFRKSWFLVKLLKIRG